MSHKITNVTQNIVIVQSRVLNPGSSLDIGEIHEHHRSMLRDGIIDITSNGNSSVKVEHKPKLEQPVVCEVEPTTDEVESSITAKTVMEPEPDLEESPETPTESSDQSDAEE